MRRQVLAAGMLFVAVDSLMTFGFGMFTGSDVYFKPVMAVALGAASGVLGGILVPLTAYLYERGYRLFPYFLCCVLFIGFWLNLASNAGFSAAMLQTEIVQAKNANVLARDAREHVARLRKRDAELTARINWEPQAGGKVWLSPEAYDGMINAAKQETENGRNIWQRSKQCTNTTLESSQRVCQRIASLEATRANAMARTPLINERNQVRAELKDAERYSKQNQMAVSAGASQAEFVARFVTANLKPGQAVMDWTTMLTALAISFLISLLGWTLNAAAILLPAPERPEEQRAHVPQPRYLPAEPIALHAEDARQAQAERENRMEQYRMTTTFEERQAHNKSRLEDDLLAWAESFERKAGQLRGAA